MRALFCAGYNLTLCGKVALGSANENDAPNYFVEHSPGKYYYGECPHEYLFARVVKELRCERNETNECEDILFWTELETFLPAPDQRSVPTDGFNYFKGASGIYRVIPEGPEQSYTYSVKYSA